MAERLPALLHLFLFLVAGASLLTLGTWIGSTWEDIVSMRLGCLPWSRFFGCSRRELRRFRKDNMSEDCSPLRSSPLAF